ncbi:zf-TFIIB domain-containing protein [Cellulomonas sp. C5510]|uniref:TFIIB-type zinc ribbon-containing protein n=1 Tax=Cellulomonas sp. C5510 TaxID=2871170 RepID=UPI001C940302|nr:zf-TFIIB domain-containing protein [Cellulomonas sp. C5510]QZN85725.1 zf-TFIIB domain-containing protein [Cellulomonas sp. C5510]
MRCPTDGAELVMAERQGVEIDYCPSCRGIWLDRGELDKILDRAAGVPAGAPPAPAVPLPPEAGYGGFPPAPAPPGHGDDRRYDDRYRDDRRDPRYRDDRRDPRYPYGRKKRRESWLGDLLDFD